MHSKLANRRAMGWIELLACAMLSAVTPMTLANAEPPAMTGSTGAPVSQPSANYRLAPKDTVHVKVFQEDDLETSARIDKDGNIPFPLLGTAKIGGQTVQEATATMEALLRAYLIKPLVSLDVVLYSKRRFTILGQVNRPGVFEIPDETSISLLEAIGMADGYSKIANPAKIKVKRIVNGQETIIPVNAKEMMDPKKGFSFEVLPGDTINVGEAIF